MDEQVKTILLTFFFDLSIFLMELSIFFCIRSGRGDEKRGGGLFNYNPVNFTLKEYNKDEKESILSEQGYIDGVDAGKSSANNNLESQSPGRIYQSFEVLENINNYKVPLSGRKSVY